MAKSAIFTTIITEEELTHLAGLINVHYYKPDKSTDYNEYTIKYRGVYDYLKDGYTIKDVHQTPFNNQNSSLAKILITITFEKA